MPSGSNTRALQVRVERLPGDARDDVAEQKEIDVAVDERLAGSRRRHFVLRELDRRVVAGPRMQIDIGPQARHVRQQVTDRDAALAVPLESGDVARHRVVEPEASVLDRASSRPWSWPRPWSTKRDRRPYQESSALPRAPWRGSRTPFRTTSDRRWPTTTTAPGVSLAAMASRDEVVDAADHCGRFDSALTGRLAGQNLAQGGHAETRSRPVWSVAFERMGANILSRLQFFQREIQAMRDSKTFLSAAALVAALVVAAVPAAAQTGRIGGTDQGPAEPAPEGRDGHRGKPGRVALVVHGDDRRQGPLFDHRPAHRHVEDHGVGAGLRALVRQRAGAHHRRADAAGRLRAGARRRRPGRRARRREHQGAAGRAAEGHGPRQRAASTTRRSPPTTRSSPRRRR